MEKIKSTNSMQNVDWIGFTTDHYDADNKVNDKLESPLTQYSGYL